MGRGAVAGSGGAAGLNECANEVSTLCSGTESPALVWEAFAQAAAAELKVVVTVSHQYAAECSPPKQEFIKCMFPGTRIFEDATRLWEGSAFEVTSQERTAVPKADLVFAGFPCTDASRMNPRGASVENRSCLQAGTLRTGSVFAGIHKLAQAQRDTIRALVLENVCPLAESPRDKRGRVCGPSNLSALG